MPRATHRHPRLHVANALVAAATEPYDDHMVGRRGLICVVGVAWLHRIQGRDHRDVGWCDVQRRTRCSMGQIEAVVEATPTLAAGDNFVELDPAWMPWCALPAAAAALTDCDHKLLAGSPLGWTIALAGRLPAGLRNPRAEPAGASVAGALLAWGTALENSVAGHVDVIDQRDVFEQVCSAWLLDAGRVEMVLQQRFSGAVQVDAPWREHDPEMIRATVR